MNDYIDIQMIEKLGTGTFGEVYSFLDCKTNRKMALKIEKKNCDLLKNEYKIYMRLHRSSIKFCGDSTDKQIVSTDFICQAYFYGQVKFNDELNNAMVMDLLGMSLQKLFVLNNKVFFVKKVLRLGIMMIGCVEFLHSKCFVHRDIKPDNFVFGRGQDRNKLYLIDLGLAKKYKNSMDTHMPQKKGRLLVGTARYASINVHREGQSRRDDLKSLGYCLLFFAKGKLPWQGIKVSKKIKKHSDIQDMKEKISLEDLCEFLPNCFYLYMRYVREL